MKGVFGDCQFTCFPDCQLALPPESAKNLFYSESVMQDVVIVAATRTAIGSFQGSLANVPAVELGATVIRALLEKTGIDPAQVLSLIHI